MKIISNKIYVILLFALTACGGGGGGGGDDGDDGGGSVTSTTFKTFQLADVAIGQPDFTSGLANQGGAPGANTLSAPSGAPAAGSLYVVDRANNRILGFNSIPITSGASADFVIGQSVFTSSGTGAAADKLNFPGGILTDGGRLIVVDIFNHRVLIWNTLPTTSNVPANVVLGAASFNDAAPGTTQTELRIPQTIAVANGQLFVSDGGNNRVLIWNSIPNASNAPADVVIGQVDFVSGGPGLSATQLTSPAGIWSDGQRLVVADSVNNRVLIWNSIPSTNGAAADLVVGQPDFVTNTATTTSQGLNFPFGVFSNGQELYISDTDNHRVLIFDDFPTTNQPSADRVLGQSDFLKSAENDDDQDGNPDATPSARTLNNPSGINIVDSQLYVTDNSNSRVLIFQPN